MLKDAAKAGGDDRLSSDEVDALRIKLHGASDSPIDLRAHGALTVADMAEALGLAPADVAAHLDQLRAERAFGRSTPKQRSQRFLLGLAIVLLAGAGFTYLRTPKILSEEESARPLVRSGPKKATYPIVASVDLGANGLPPGLSVQMDGMLTTTRAASTDSTIPTVEEATERLEHSLQAVYAQAAAAEKAAPPPKTALPPRSYNGQPIVPGVLMVTIASTSGTSTLSLPLEPREGHTESVEEMVEKSIKLTSVSIIQGAWERQLASLDTEVDAQAGGWTTPPIGFGLSVEGRRRSSIPKRAITLRPVDEGGVARKLEILVHASLRNDTQDASFGSLESRAADRKIPVPAWTSVRIDGPFAVVTFRVPTAPSDTYKTAVDVVRASDQIIASNVAKAADQVRQINAGAHS